MSRFFLGPIKNPTWKDFVIRVGGVSLLFIVGILTAKAFFPGSESIAIFIIGIVVGVLVAIQTIRHNQNVKKTKHSSKKK